MKGIVDSVNQMCQDLKRRMSQLEKYVGIHQEFALESGENSLQNSWLEGILGLLKKQSTGPELTIVGVEQTQAIQYFSINGQGSGYAPDNSIPLIAQRPLILRVYVNNGRGPRSIPMFVTGQVTVDRLHSYSPSTRVGTIDPINGPILARPSAAIDRGDPNHTLNFRLSAAQCQGHLQFRVTVRVQHQVALPSVSMALEQSASTASPIENTPFTSALELHAPDDLVASPEGPSRTMTVYRRFEKVPTFRVRAILIHYTGGGQDLPAPSGLDFAATLIYVLATYPIGRLEFSECMEMEYSGDLSAPGGGCMGWEALINWLMAMQPSEDKAIYVALIPKAVYSPFILGCGNRGVAAAKVGDGDVLAQEIGHALGRKHAPGAPGADPDFPTYNGYPQASIGEFGFNTSTSKIYDPARSFDFMGYRSNRWVSPYTYMALRYAMVDRFDNSQAAAAQPAGAQHETLFLHFSVDRGGSLHDIFGFHLTTPLSPRRSENPSDVCLELLDESGAVLAFHRCQVTAKYQDPDGPSIVFNETIPWTEQATSIQFLRNSKVLHIHEIEKSTPNVEIKSPKIECNDNRIRLEWSGYHQETETELTYMVRYSNDGGQTWRVVAANLSDPVYQLKMQQLPGGKQCLFQVVASSGIRTCVAQTEAFSSDLKPRTAFIVSPEQNTEVHESNHLVLRGGAFSPDFGIGELEDGVWCSNLDGSLGQGIEIVADNLSSGFHTITLTVPNGLGGVATACVSVRVSRDGDCNW